MEVNSNLKELWREKDLIDDQIKCLVAELENVIYAYKNVVKLKAEVEEELVKALKQKEELILELAKYNDR